MRMKRMRSKGTIDLQNYQLPDLSIPNLQSNIHITP